MRLFQRRRGLRSFGDPEDRQNGTPRVGSDRSPGTTVPANPSKNRAGKEVNNMAHKKTTGKKAAKAASKTLRDGRTSKTSKSAAGSALSQTHKGKAGKKK
jgi:hypothetical protein